MHNPGAVGGPEKAAEVQSILVIDDMETTRRLEQTILEGAGFQVFTAVNGRDGIRAAQRLNPDLILMDIQMPIMDGFDCCQALKADERTREIKIVMVTGEERRDQVNRAFAMGCDGYVTKPIESNDLLRKVRSLLRLSRARRQLRGLL